MAGEGPNFPYLSELEWIRHYTRLSTRNFGVDTGMYPLGSGTMKYNPKTNPRQAALPGIQQGPPAASHFVVSGGAQNHRGSLERLLAEITGLDAVTLQPAAGAHGAPAACSLSLSREQGSDRLKIIAPIRRMERNPASATLCGYHSVNVKIQ